MLLGDYYVHDPRVVLIPIEHLSPAGVSAELIDFLSRSDRISAASLDLFQAAFVLYWQRCAALAQRTRTWPAPRLRHAAIVATPDDVRPYAQMLNTSAWTLYAADLDPAASHAELVAYLLALGDRMAVTGEVTMASVHCAPWWFERGDDECAAFTAAARRSIRPDADGLRAVADAVPWLRRLRHEALRPPPRIVIPGRGEERHRPIPASGLLVPQALEREPPALVERWTRVATRAVARHHECWRAPDRAALDALLRWLESEAPPLVVTGRREAVLWQPEYPDRVGALRQEMRSASGAGVREVHADLRLVAERTRAFLAALAAPEDLPQPSGEPEQRGYAYLRRDGRRVAYNLHEPGIERLRGPALPYARAMLGARVAHEWCHLAVDAGWVPAASEERLAAALAHLGDRLDEAIVAAPASARAAAAADLQSLGDRPGHALAAVILPRFDDFRANLLAARFVTRAEQETYVRQNVRTLRGEYEAGQLFRMLARYLYEYQYLRFSLVRDRRTFFLRSTWFDDDFLRTGILAEQRFDALVAAVGAVADCFAVDESRFRA